MNVVDIVIKLKIKYYHHNYNMWVYFLQRITHYYPIMWYAKGGTLFILIKGKQCDHSNKSYK